jgi:hypothetical protein
LKRFKKKKKLNENIFAPRPFSNFRNIQHYYYLAKWNRFVILSWNDDEKNFFE